VMYFVSSHYYNKAKTYLGEPKTVRILKNFIINNKFLILLLIILALVLGEIVLFVRIF